MELFLLNAIVNKVLITIISCVLFILGYKTLNSPTRRTLEATEKLNITIKDIFKVEMDSVLPGTVFVISGLAIAIFLFSSPITEKIEQTAGGAVRERSGLGPSASADVEKYKEFSAALRVVDGVLSVPKDVVSGPDWEELYKQKSIIEDMQGYFERKTNSQGESK